jgi:hemolysin activation/secretion protein
MKFSSQLICLSLAALPLAVGAQSFSPDAGSLLSATQDSLSGRDERQLEGFPVEYYPRLRWTDDFSVQVDSIAIHGNTLVPTEKLESAVKGFVGKRMVVQKLPNVSAAVNKVYRDAGFRVKAYIPEQSFARGRLVVQVIETGTYR